jgi:phosphatidylserine/phosphatidylglycerophosphate/cardiolipin synthase-like enzyme
VAPATSRSAGKPSRASTWKCSRRGDFRITEAYLRALRSAQHLVYMENQFLWSPEIVNILADKLHRPPAESFRVVVMLPGRPKSRRGRHPRATRAAR